MHNQKGKKRTARVFIGILNATFACGLIMGISSLAIFSWFTNGGPSVVPEKRLTWVLVMLPLFCIGLIMIACAIVDLITMIKLKRNPYDEKTKRIRKIGKNIFQISLTIFVLLVCFGLVIVLPK